MLQKLIVKWVFSLYDFFNFSVYMECSKIRERRDKSNEWFYTGISCDFFFLTKIFLFIAK